MSRTWLDVVNDVLKVAGEQYGLFPEGPDEELRELQQAFKEEVRDMNQEFVAEIEAAQAHEKQAYQHSELGKALEYLKKSREHLEECLEDDDPVMQTLNLVLIAAHKWYALELSGRADKVLQGLKDDAFQNIIEDPCGDHTLDEMILDHQRNLLDAKD